MSQKKSIPLMVFYRQYVFLVVGVLLAALSISMAFEQYFVPTVDTPNTLHQNSFQEDVVFDASSMVAIQLSPRTQPIQLVTAVQENGIWKTNNKAASIITPTATNSGVVLYGHNWKKIFQPLHDLTLGDSITAYSQNGGRANYIVTSIEVVSPQRNSEFPAISSDQILLYTCTGFLDLQRLVLIASRFHS